MTASWSRAVVAACAALALVPGRAGAQPDAAAADSAAAPAWDYSAVAGVQFSQSAYSRNWAGGDRGAIVWVVNGDLTAERAFPPSFHLKNALQLAYGQTSKQVSDPGRPGETVWDRPEKSTDLVLFESTGRFTLGGWVDPYLGFRLDTQFRDQSDPRGELPFHPLKLTESAGIARVVVKTPERELTSRIGAAFRQTLARAFVDPAGASTESYSTLDGGLEWQTEAKFPLLENAIVYKSRLLVYQPVFFTKSGALETFDALALAFDPSREPVADFWRAPDVNWQNTFAAQITKSLSVSLYAQLVYDKFEAASKVDTGLPIAEQIANVDRGIRKAGQFKQTLAVGLTWTLF